MFDKDKIPFFGDIVNEVTGPTCSVREDSPVIGGHMCQNCKYCYGVRMRVWDSTDKTTGLVWNNGQYDGYVYCSYCNPPFISKLKNRIFRLKKQKVHIKHLGK